MKWILLVGVVVAAGLILRALHRRQVANCVSPDWLVKHAQRDAQFGVDLPRWRFPAERRELAKRERLARIAEARQQTGERRRA